MVGITFMVFITFMGDTAAMRVVTQASLVSGGEALRDDPNKGCGGD